MRLDSRTIDSKCGECGHWHWYALCAVCSGCTRNVSRERLDRVAALVARGTSQRAAYIVIDAAMSGVGCVPQQYRHLPAAQMM